MIYAGVPSFRGLGLEVMFQLYGFYCKSERHLIATDNAIPKGPSTNILRTLGFYVGNY